MIVPNIILAGPPGVGKSTVGRLIAEDMGWRHVDLDDMILDAAGWHPADIIRHQGEPAFRAVERRVTVQFCRSVPRACVISTGGGTCLDPASRRALAEIGPIVLLEAPTRELAARIATSPDSRPLLRGEGEDGIRRLLAVREAAYGTIPRAVQTAGLTPVQAAERVATLVADTAGANLEGVALSGRSAVMGEGALAVLGSLARARLPGARIALVYDNALADELAPLLEESFQAAGCEVLVALPLAAGESTKRLAAVEHLAGLLAEAGLTREDVIVVLGGGTITDVVGFTAATYLRGVRWISCPTTVVGQADAGLGGKTGVNIAAGKNLIGAFHAPALIAIDWYATRGLPAEQRLCGLAEIIRSLIIGAPDLIGRLEAGGAPAVDDTVGWAELTAAAVRIKARLVRADPLDQNGARAKLNLGHTFAHAIERVTDYQVPHGQAVAIGIACAAELADNLGLTGAELLAPRLRRLLEQLGLPARLPPDAPASAVIEATRTDKKREADGLALVLPHALGDVRVVRGVADEDVRVALVQAAR